MERPDFTTVEYLNPGDFIDVGDATEEPVFVTVEYVTHRGNQVRVSTKELAFDLMMTRGDQVTFSEEG
ncbi:hypothetical protein [Streptomyces sp. PsTaAH-124]|uniref:hypothetical protein n=1 Tax=Streptomyces sp. PsTaAH-124 TaxID=1157638 RepID=UPI001319D371|nr:hypothetical protein [Streptomyces sp. PsTaAH-124]